MATEVKRRRGTTDQHFGGGVYSGFTGATAELTVNTEEWTVHVHDNSTLGGHPLLRADFNNVPTTAPFTHITLDTAIFDTTYTETESETQGTLYWNSDEETLSLVTNGSTLELGHKTELHVKVTQTGGVSRGDVVAATGAVGGSGKIEVQKFSAGTSPTKTIVGIMDEDVVQGEFGKAIAFGKIRGLDMSAFNEGDILYASTTAGELTDTEPSDGNVSLPIAYVVDNSVNTGEIFVRVTPIDENAYQDYDAGLTDIAGLTPTDGNFIVGDGTNWVAESGATALASLGAQAQDPQLDDIAGLTPTDGNFIVGNGTNFVAESGNTARTSLGLGTSDSPTFNGLTSIGVIITDEIDTTSITWNVSTLEWDADPSEKFNNPVFIGTSLDVDNGINADQHVHAGTYLKADTYLEVGTSATIGTTLDVSGNTTIGGTLSVTGNTTISGTLDAPTLNTGQGDNELYAMNQNVRTSDSVTFDTLAVTNNATVGGSLTLTGEADFNSTMNLQGNLTTQANLADDGFVEGWAGTNWKINADGSAEFEEMRIRGALRVYEFIAKQISTIGGSEILSIAQGRVSSVNVGAETITVENVTGTAGNAFKANDLWICQVVDINNDLESGGTGSIVKSVRGTVTSVSGNDIVVTIDAGDITQLEQGDLIIAYGNEFDTNRQAIMYRNVDRSEDNLIMRLQTGITEFSELQAVGNTRVAFGDLNGYSGLSAETFGFFAGDNSNEHILVTDGGLFLKDGNTTLAQLTSNTFKVGNGTKYVEFDGTDLDVQAEDFKLTAGELVIDSSLDKKIKISNATEEIIAIGDFDFGSEVVDTSTASASSSSTTATLTSATPTNSDTNMDTAVGTLNSNVSENGPIVTLSRTYNVTGKWVRVQFDYEAPEYDNEALSERAVGFSITYFGSQIQQLFRDEFDASAISGSVDETIFVPDTATFNTIQVQALASSGGLSQFEVHGKINVSNLSVTVYDDTYTYTDIGNDGFRVYNSGGNKKIEFKDGNATATLDTLSIGSWDFELASNGDLVLKYEGTTVQTFTKPT